MKFSIEDMETAGLEPWTGVRNFEASKIMREIMRVDDLCFFYHSSCKAPGIAGLVRVAKVGLVDPTQFQKNSHFFDPKATEEAPRWYMVEVEFVRKLKGFIPLKELQEHKGKLSSMTLLNRGRLSVQKVSKEEFDFILELENK